MAGGSVTRFAPSPTGPLHLGHAFAALIAAARGERFLLRIEDIDQSRCRPAWETAICDDLRWLGLRWSGPVIRQSQRRPAYDAALAQLAAMELTYRCTCTRGDIRAALSAPQEGTPQAGATPTGPDGPVYPGTCRDKPRRDAACNDRTRSGEALTSETAAIRLNMRAAIAAAGQVAFTETGPGFAGLHQISPAHLIEGVGDIVLARRDLGTAYHLAVVVDDAAQGITEVTRGEDLLEATAIHVVLQRLLGLPTPLYHHHRLIRDNSGKRLAKRDDARALARYRAEGAGPADIRAMIGL